MSEDMDYVPRGTLAYDLERLRLALRLLVDVVRRTLPGWLRL